MASLRDTPAFSSLPVRTLTGVVWAGALAGALFIRSPLGIGLLLGIVGASALAELYRIVLDAPLSAAEFIGLGGTAALPAAAALGGVHGVLIALALTVVASAVWHVRSSARTTTQLAVVVFGVVYVGATLSHFVLVRSLDTGIVLALAVLVSVWASDVLAYLVGSLIGTHKMAPRISPKKSWEGFVAGTAGTVAVWLALPLVAETALSLAWRGVLGIVVALAAVLGDLLESRIKRAAGVKDSGTVLPGHGGFLDRIDSLLLVSVAAYYLLLAAGLR